MAVVRANTFDMWLEVNEDINGRHSQPMIFGTAPEPEGQTAGVMDACDVETFCGPCGENEGGVGDATGFDIPLGPIAEQGDGSWSDGAVPLFDDTPVSSAIDKINELLKALVPAAPPAFPNASLAISNLSGSTPRLAAGVTDNTGDAFYAAGALVNRLGNTGVSSFLFNDVGPGKSGVMSITLNGAVVASHTMTGSDEGSYSGLLIQDQKDYPVGVVGLYKSFDTGAVLVPALVGVNKFKMGHSEAGQTGTVYFVRDDMGSVPALSGGAVAQAAAGAIAYSSGVPHYGTGGQLLVSASMTNLAGETYYGSAPFSVSASGGVFSTQAFDYPALGITTPIPRQTLSATPFDVVTVNVDGAVHSAGLVSGTVRNVNGSTSGQLSSTTILVKRGTAASNKIDEMSVPVIGLGILPNALNAVRVAMDDGDHPTNVPAAWNSAALIEDWDAAVVGGVLRHDTTDYSSGAVLPLGPDYSVGRDGEQYATFKFQRVALSNFKINVTGNYSGCWVKLPGVSDAQPNAPGGWWNGFAPYDGAGVPGEAGDTLAGCATGSNMNGASGVFTMTFGTQSSTNATDNTVLVHFRLSPGQQISALAFTN